jgi:16S rRNA (guanine1516-N2)-methyltransferase
LDYLIGVSADTADDGDVAALLAGQLGVALLPAHTRARDLPSQQLFLRVVDGVGMIQLTGPGAPGPVNVGFEGGALAHRRRAGHNELLGRAVGWKQARQPRVLDATGGFGRDAFLLADLGCDVLLCERQPLMAFLLGEALHRAASAENRWLGEVSARIRLHAADARELPASEVAACDSIYLDPMFPSQRRAAPGKEMQILQLLLEKDPQEAGSGCEDTADLLHWALAQAVSRVVVKRPRRAAPLGAVAPGHSIEGRAVRFDVYPCPGRESRPGTDAAVAAGHTGSNPHREKHSA